MNLLFIKTFGRTPFLCFSSFDHIYMSLRFDISIMDGVMAVGRSGGRDRGVFKEEHETNMLVAEINSYYSLGDLKQHPRHEVLNIQIMVPFQRSGGKT